MIPFQLISRKYSGAKFLHIIYSATRFSTAAVVCWKRKEEIVDTFIKHWIAIFGAPGILLSDNDGQFNNSLFLHMAEQVTITLKTTAAKSPRSNGMVVRHNGISAKTIKKLILDSNNKYSMDAVIAWAVNAKNSQLVFGHKSAIVFG